ncbi:uncharacterized protein LY89DRAFT_739856 [Mollisia scopiformis]|uniref:Heterokaryon incompatibility domain-containing protein n=1 Tax=Mollisia scopiformis TaxID=149040 RepID=A0A194WSD4_MOLSC|nr:uncharacterized protein LY89DRAFT_739856 [Mollisia scopiformis]KUJ10875.1 hypothetical protein LY89DRAFT_739856 [Mollisia scopiformis]
MAASSDEQSLPKLERRLGDPNNTPLVIEEPSIYKSLTPRSSTTLEEPCEQKFFRLLTILPGVDPAIMECKLEVAVFPVDMPFEALSYEAEERLVWVDALCINQDDLAERSQQVMLMRDIYSVAHRVVVWLGEDNGQAAEALAIIKKAANFYLFETNTPLSRLSTELWPESDKIKYDPMFPEREANSIFRGFPTLPEFNDTTTPSPWNSVAWFYDLEWFKRVWIIQEVAFSPTIIAAAILSTRFAENQSISTLISMGLYSRSTDPRDKVFGLLGLTDDKTRSNVWMKSDYTRSTAEVYMNTIRYIILANEPDGRLSDVFANITSYPGDENDKYPSWVPRWDSFTTPDQFSAPIQFAQWKAGGGRDEEVNLPPHSEILNIKGVLLGTVYRVDDAIANEKNSLEPIKQTWDRFHEELEDSTRVETLECAFIRTVTAGHACLSELSGSARLFEADDLKNCFDFIAGVAEDNGSVTRAQKLLNSTRNLPFFTTTDKHMGLAGNKSILSGDILCVFFGHRMPSVLRPVGEEYRFLGPCYIHGYMYGGAIEKLESGELEERWFLLC